MGVVESGAGRAVGDAERLGDLRGLQARVVAEHEQCPLLWVKSAEATLELIPVGDAQKRVVKPGKIGREQEQVGGGLAIPDRGGDAGTDDKAVHPRVEPGRIAEAPQVTPGDHQRILEGILGPIDIADDPLRDRIQPVDARTDEVREGLLVAALRLLDEIAIHCVAPRVTPSGGAFRQ